MIIAMERGIKLRIELSNIIIDYQTPYILGSTWVWYYHIDLINRLT